MGCPNCGSENGTFAREYRLDEHGDEEPATECLECNTVYYEEKVQIPKSIVDEHILTAIYCLKMAREGLYDNEGWSKPRLKLIIKELHIIRHELEEVSKRKSSRML